MERFSKKRQAILSCLRGTADHPTAEWIYAHLKPEYPDLSLATVYRNLGQLKAAGLVRSVGVVNGQERFDGNPQTHPHAICRKCGAVLDLAEPMLPAPKLAQTETAEGFLIEEVTVQVFGLCPRCRAAKGGESNGQ